MFSRWICFMRRKCLNCLCLQIWLTEFISRRYAMSWRYWGASNHEPIHSRFNPPIWAERCAN